MVKNEPTVSKNVTEAKNSQKLLGVLKRLQRALFVILIGNLNTCDLS